MASPTKLISAALAGVLVVSAFPVEAAELAARPAEIPFVAAPVPALSAAAAPGAVALALPTAVLAPALGPAFGAAAAPTGAVPSAGVAAPAGAASVPDAAGAPALAPAAGPDFAADSAAAAEPSSDAGTQSAAAAPRTGALSGLGRYARPSRLRRAARALARATGVSALWGVYSDGVLVQRDAEQLTDSGRDAAQRAQAARRLGSRGRLDALPLLGWAADQDESPRVRRSARSALLRLSAAAEPGLIRTLKAHPFSLSREQAAKNLGVIVARSDAPAALEALGAAALLDRSEGVRLVALSALSGALSPKAEPTLVWIASVETRRRSSAAAVRALADLRARRAADGSARVAGPQEDLPLAANPLHAAALKSSIAVGLGFAAVELAGGIMTGTLALRADALHLAGDRALDAAALFAMWIARRPPTSRKTYGWLKAEAVMSFVGALGIAALGVGLIPGVVASFLHPARAEGWGVLGFAALSIVSNAISAAMLYRHQSEHQGLRGAFLHAMTDAVGTFGIMAAAAASLAWGVAWALPLASAAMVLMVLRVAWELGRPAVDVLLDAVPAGLDMDRLEADLASAPGVAAVYDLHVRALNSAGAELVAKLYAKPGADQAAILASANAYLRERYGIVHATIQIEPLPAAGR
jgi:cobalt-zinc-cadmium efflux system protein